MDSAFPLPNQKINTKQTKGAWVKLSCPAVGTNWQPHPGTLAVWRPTMLEVMSFYSRTKQSTLFIKPPNSAEGGFNHETLLHPPPSSPSRLHPLALRHLLWEAVFLKCSLKRTPKRNSSPKDNSEAMVEVLAPLGLRDCCPFVK